MSYLMGEILIYLSGVAVLGVIVGWLFTRATYLRKIEDAEVALLNKLHEATQKLELTQEQLDNTSEELEVERGRESENVHELQQLQEALSKAQSKFDERKQQVDDLTKSMEQSDFNLKQAEDKLAQQTHENQTLMRDFDLIKKRLTNFQVDLEDIVQQSSLLKSAFERARLALASKDKRIAELESTSSNSIQVAAVSGSSEPELAISRIARLQNRVQELFDEVEQKDQEIQNLKGSITIDKEGASFINMTEMQADDLKKIGGIGGQFEEKLNKIGITRFRDIAAWDDSDIDRIDQMLDFEGRIKRENWVEQAQSLIKTVPTKPRQH